MLYYYLPIANSLPNIIVYVPPQIVTFYKILSYLVQWLLSKQILGEL